MPSIGDYRIALLNPINSYPILSSTVGTPPITPIIPIAPMCAGYRFRYPCGAEYRFFCAGYRFRYPWGQGIGKKKQAAPSGTACYMFTCDRRLLALPFQPES